MIFFLATIGVSLSPDQYYWSLSFLIYISVLFLIRMQTWKTANINAEILVFTVSNFIWIGTLAYLYYYHQLSCGIVLQIFGFCAFAVVLMRYIYTEKINLIAENLIKDY